MRKFIRHPLTMSVFVAVLLYVVFAHVLQPPLPKSLLAQYMVISIIGILLVATFNENTARRLTEPMRRLLADPGLGIARGVAMVVVVVAVGGVTFLAVKPDTSAPVELRTIHPAPPSNIRVYGKKFNLLKLTNPLRDSAPKGTKAYAENVSKGAEVYYKNCIYCHGDKLEGKGQFAEALTPRPANFQDVGTIAQLQESYLFWRITTGAPGLPREGAPWASAMPVWHEMLSEDDVWKTILFLYDYTGHEPRSWELAEKSSELDAASKATANGTGALDHDAIEAVYNKRCVHCHGVDGDGSGPAAKFLYPLPRDFTLATFKYKTTHADDEFPTDDDFRKTINYGLPGTSMPGWKSRLSSAEVDGLITMIKEFGGWEEEEIEFRPIVEGEVVPPSPESEARGRKIFVKACVQCHGNAGRGDITSGKRLADDAQNRIWPRNLTRPNTWRASRTVRDVFQRISTGIRGTPMPEHTTTMPERDRWDVSNYVMTLRDTAVQQAAGETVVRGQFLEGPLPTSPDDPAWDKALPLTLPMIPNVIKEPRLFTTLNQTVTARVLFNATDMAVRLDVDDRTYSVPGDPLEERYRLEGVEPTRDAIAVQFPAHIPTTSEKPWFRHGDSKKPVNMWFWRAPSVAPERSAEVMVLDATGPNSPPVPRHAPSDLEGRGVWKDGQWRVVMTRALNTEDAADLQFETGRYIPIAFADWDGLAGEAGGRHAFTSWYWLLLEAEAKPLFVYGTPGGAALLAGLLFMGAVRRGRRTWQGT